MPQETLAGGTGQPSALLRAALQPLERASELYEDLIARAAGDDLLAAEQIALERVVERISKLGRRIAEVDAGPAPPFTEPPRPLP